MVTHAQTANTGSSSMVSGTAITASEEMLAAFGAGSLLLRRDMWSLCLTAFIAMMLSKIGALLPGMSPDDYFFALGNPASGAAHTLVAQGRGLNALLAMLIDAMGASFANVYSFTFFLASAAISLAIASSITLTKSNQINRVHHHAAAALAATHPFLTSYFIFRMSLANHAIVYSALFIALWIISTYRTPWHKMACILLLAACSHVSQIILILFAISAGAWSLATYCSESNRGANLRHSASSIISFVLILGSATILYLLSSEAARHIMHVSATADYSLHLNGSVFNTIYTAIKLAYEMLLTAGPVLPRGLKLWLLFTLVAAIALCFKSSPVRGISCLVLLGCGILITVSTMALSWGGFVPRTFSPIGLCLALVFCLACDTIKLKQSLILSIAVIVTTISFCFIGSSMFYQQMMLTRWDQATAAAIYNRVTQKASDDTPIRIAASWPIHKQPLTYSAPGINESAFLYPWAYPGLFAVATGERLNVTEGDRSMCSGIPAWPSPDSMKRLDDGSMLVCMVR